jgi:hypothetical protein
MLRKPAYQPAGIMFGLACETKAIDMKSAILLILSLLAVAAFNVLSAQTSNKPSRFINASEVSTEANTDLVLKPNINVIAEEEYQKIRQQKERNQPILIKSGNSAGDKQKREKIKVVKSEKKHDCKSGTTSAKQKDNTSCHQTFKKKGNGKMKLIEQSEKPGCCESQKNKREETRAVE